MAQPSTPQYLFRAYSDDSNGYNMSTYIGPQLPPSASCKRLHGLLYDPNYGSLHDQLRNAILGYKAVVNPSTFWTSSFFCVLLHAIKKFKAKEPMVQIVCIRTAGVTKMNEPASGDKVIFQPLRAVMEKLGIRPISAQWTGLPLDYADVWITTDSVLLSTHSARVSLEDLEFAGLYGLMSELGIIRRRGISGFATPMADLRKLWYGAERVLVKEKDLISDRITIAARLAMAFQDPSVRFETGDIPLHIFIWFLALKVQSPDGVNLKGWLKRNSAKELTDCTDCQSTSDALQTPELATPELEQWTRLYAKLQRRRISAIGISLALPTHILLSFHAETLQREEEGYREFKKRKREDEKEKEIGHISKKSKGCIEEYSEDQSGQRVIA